MGEYIFAVQNGVVSISKWGENTEGNRVPMVLVEKEYNKKNFDEIATKFETLANKIAENERALEDILS